ncbi:hypothetical protein TrRE_jg5714 [Triparma retinervis]|uniref:Uncharacterized protein n=1 Tax=Triparma retinervis TaxID=2557542 RepID=A0A9W7A280_9STRA|nr:hypothetical protein TrRE_jg5714 [Triparma retinervis]
MVHCRAEKAFLDAWHNKDNPVAKLPECIMDTIFAYAASDRPDRVVCSGGSLTTLGREDCRVDKDDQGGVGEESGGVMMGELTSADFYDYDRSREDSKSEYDDQRLRKGGYTVVVRKRGVARARQSPHAHKGGSRAMEAFVCGALIVGGGGEIKGEGGTAGVVEPPLSSSPTSVCEMIRCWGMCNDNVAMPTGGQMQTKGKISGAWLGDLRELGGDLGF